jgi:hypothetical protein
MSLTNKNTAATTASETSTALAHQGTNTVSQNEGEIPFFIRNNPKSLKMWEEASEDERNAGLLLCEFQNRSTKAEILDRFDFADRWNAAFPKANKKLYERGMEAIKIGAQLAGISPSTVYSNLRTTGFYKRSGYEALYKKAEANGVEIPWITLRLIVERLEKNTEARTKVEREIVRRRMTEAELNKLIDSVAPESARKKSGTDSEKELTVAQHFAAMVSAFKKLSLARAKFEQVMEDFNDNFDGTADQAKVVLEQTSALIGSFEEIQDFMDAKVMFVTQLRDAAQTLVDGEGRKKAVKSSAEKIRKQIAAEKTEHQKKESARSAAAVARGDTDDVVITDLDDESTDPSDEELNDIDDEIEVDDTDDRDIFDEIGGIQ